MIDVQKFSAEKLKKDFKKFNLVDQSDLESLQKQTTSKYAFAPPIKQLVLPSVPSLNSNSSKSSSQINPPPPITQYPESNPQLNQEVNRQAVSEIRQQQDPQQSKPRLDLSQKQGSEIQEQKQQPEKKQYLNLFQNPSKAPENEEKKDSELKQLNQQPQQQPQQEQQPEFNRNQQAFPNKYQSSSEQQPQASSNQTFQQTPNQFNKSQSEKNVYLVNSKLSNSFKLFWFHEMIVVLTPKEVYLVNKQKIFEENLIFKCIDSINIIDGYEITKDLIVLNITSEKDDCELGGLVLIQFNIDVINNSSKSSRIQQPNQSLESSTWEHKVQILMGLDKGIISDVSIDTDLEALFYSTQSGNIRGLSFNLEELFFYEDVKMRQIQSILYDNENDILMYSTNQNNLVQYKIDEEKILNNNQNQHENKGQILYLQYVKFQEQKKCLLEVTNNNNMNGFVSLLSNSTFKNLKSIQTICPTYNSKCKSSVQVSVIKNDEQNLIYTKGMISDCNKLLVGVTNGKEVEIIQIELDGRKLKNIKMTSIFKQSMASTVRGFVFERKTGIDLLEILYSNPTQVNDDKYAQDACRKAVNYFTKS